MKATPDNVEIRIIQDFVRLEKTKLKEKGRTTYIFKATVTIFKTAKFTINLTGSNGVKIADQKGLIATKEMEPFKKYTIIKAICDKTFVFRPKYSVVLNIPPLETQMKMMLRVHEQLSKDLEDNASFCREYNFQSATEAQIKKLFEANRKRRFLDVNFPPKNESLGFAENQIANTWGCVVHWRDPAFFLYTSEELKAGKKVPKIIEKVRVGDVRPGKMHNFGLMGALNILSEFPNLLRRLFLSKDLEPAKMVRVKLRQMGIWKRVVADSLFPCFPLGRPILLANTVNRKPTGVWALALEKAYAKCLNGYFSASQQSFLEILLDFTGFPVEAVSAVSAGTFGSNFHREKYLGFLMVLGFEVESLNRVLNGDLI